MAELVDASALGAGGRKAVGVQVPPPASWDRAEARTFGGTLVLENMEMLGMPLRKTFALAVAIAAIAGPTAALASSGDDQYCDPFNGCGGPTTTTTTSKPGGGSGKQSGGGSQGTSSQGGGQGSSGPSTPVSSGTGASGTVGVAPTPLSPAQKAAEKAKRLAERKAMTAKYAVAVLDAAGLSPVRMTIAAR